MLSVIKYFIFAGLLVVLINFIKSDEFDDFYKKLEDTNISELSSSYAPADSETVSSLNGKSVSFELSKGTLEQKVGVIFFVLGVAIISLAWFGLVLCAIVTYVPWGIVSLLVPPLAYLYGALHLDRSLVPMTFSIIGFVFSIFGAGVLYLI